MGRLIDVSELHNTVMLNKSEWGIFATPIDQLVESLVSQVSTVEAISKADYENRLKADMVAMLTELQTEIEEYDVIGNHSTGSYDADLYNGAYSDGISRGASIVGEKIDKLKGDNNE